MELLLRRRHKCMHFAFTMAKPISFIHDGISPILSLPRVIDLKFPLQPRTRNITSHSMENLAFHSLGKWKMIILPILNTSFIHLSLKGFGERIFLNLGVKGCTCFSLWCSLPRTILGAEQLHANLWCCRNCWRRSPFQIGQLLCGS